MERKKGRRTTTRTTKHFDEVNRIPFWSYLSSHPGGKSIASWITLSGTEGKLLLILNGLWGWLLLVLFVLLLFWFVILPGIGTSGKLTRGYIPEVIDWLAISSYSVRVKQPDLLSQKKRYLLEMGRDTARRLSRPTRIPSGWCLLILQDLER